MAHKMSRKVRGIATRHEKSVSSAFDPCATRSTNSVSVGINIASHLVVHHIVNTGDIQATS